MSKRETCNIDKITKKCIEVSKKLLKSPKFFSHELAICIFEPNALDFKVKLFIGSEEDIEIPHKDLRFTIHTHPGDEIDDKLSWGDVLHMLETFRTNNKPIFCGVLCPKNNKISIYVLGSKEVNRTLLDILIDQYFGDQPKVKMRDIVSKVGVFKKKDLLRYDFWKTIIINLLVYEYGKTVKIK